MWAVYERFDIDNEQKFEPVGQISNNMPMSFASSNLLIAYWKTQQIGQSNGNDWRDLYWPI